MKKTSIWLSIFSMLVVDCAQAALTESELGNVTKNFIDHSQPLMNEYQPKAMPLQITNMWNKTEESFPVGAEVLFSKRGRWTVLIGGWVARFPSTTPDAIDFVICHELGHATAARFWKPGDDVERVADDFAARYCLRSVWGSEFSPERVKATTGFTWDLRVSVNPKYDPDKCTIRMIEKAADNIPVSFRECGPMER